MNPLETLREKVSQFTKANQTQQPMNMIANLEPSNTSINIPEFVYSYKIIVCLIMALTTLGLCKLKPQVIMKKSSKNVLVTSYVRVALFNVVILLCLTIIVILCNQKFNIKI